jgi:hypothetical protein
MLRFVHIAPYANVIVTSRFLRSLGLHGQLVCVPAGLQRYGFGFGFGIRLDPVARASVRDWESNWINENVLLSPVR